jgi:hypothetical protein
MGISEKTEFQLAQTIKPQLELKFCFASLKNTVLFSPRHRFETHEKNRARQQNVLIF